MRRFLFLQAQVDLTLPDEVGLIEDMPDTDTAGVIATGDGIAIDEDVK